MTTLIQTRPQAMQTRHWRAIRLVLRRAYRKLQRRRIDVRDLSPYLQRDIGALD